MNISVVISSDGIEIGKWKCVAIAMVSVVGLSRTSKGGGKNVNYIFLANELNV